MSAPEDQIHGRVDVGPDYFVQRFMDRANEQLAIMRNALRALEDDTFLERSISRPKDGRLMAFGMDFSPNIRETGRVAALGSGFVGIMRAFLDFVDTMYAMSELVQETFVVDRDMDGEEVAQYILGLIDARTHDVAIKTSLRNPDKFNRFHLLDGRERALCDRLLGLRATVEHHKGIPKADIVLPMYRLVMYADDTAITALPAMLRRGQALSVRHAEYDERFPIGRQVILSEELIENTLQTFLNSIVPKIALSVDEINSRVWTARARQAGTGLQ